MSPSDLARYDVTGATMARFTTMTSKNQRPGRVPAPAARFVIASFVLTFSVVGYAPVGFAQMPDLRRAYLDTALKDSTADDLREEYDRLFAKADLAQIKRLQLDDNTSLSLRAAWEQVRRTIKVEKGKRQVRPNPVTLNWFLGFLEGRLRTGVPDWWRETLLDARAERPGSVFFELPSKLRYHKTAFDLYAPGDTFLEELNADLVLRAGSETCKIPESLLVKLRANGGAHYIATAFSSGVCYFTLHSYLLSPYSLVCLDRASGRSFWTTEVWATGRSRYTGLSADLASALHWVSIYCQERRVIVFGGGGHGVYVEGFDNKDGKVLFRFSTSY
jgi:hypothetical protein